jgi:hypothetical protein
MDWLFAEGSGHPYLSQRRQTQHFWELLQSLGGERMWEHVKDEDSDTSWARNAMINGMLIAVTDGLYDKERAKDLSKLGWRLICSASRQTLHGSF